MKTGHICAQFSFWINHMDYDHGYATCIETFARLNIYKLPSDEVTKILGIQPESTQVAGPNPTPRIKRLLPHAWFLSSRYGSLESKDSRYHLDWLLDQLVDKKKALDILKQAGAKINISCYWESKGGPAQGGPTLSSSQARKLADLDLELWFDLY